MIEFVVTIMIVLGLIIIALGFGIIFDKNLKISKIIRILSGSVVIVVGILIIVRNLLAYFNI